MAKKCQKISKNCDAKILKDIPLHLEIIQLPIFKQ